MAWDYFAALPCPAFHLQTMTTRKDEKEGKRLGFMGWWSQTAWSSSARAGPSLDRFAFF